MWDQLIVCYRLLDKRAAAQEVISQRLKVRPDRTQPGGAALPALLMHIACVVASLSSAPAAVVTTLPLTWCVCPT